MCHERGVARLAGILGAVQRDEIAQIAFDFHWRQLMVAHAVEGGPGLPIYYTTEVMRAWLRVHLWRWDEGEITAEEYRAELREMLGIK